MIGVDEGGADWFYALLDAGLPLGSEEDVQVTKEDRPVALPEHFPLMRDVPCLLGVLRIVGKSLETESAQCASTTTGVSELTPSRVPTIVAVAGPTTRSLSRKGLLEDCRSNPQPTSRTEYVGSLAHWHT